MPESLEFYEFELFQFLNGTIKSNSHVVVRLRHTNVSIPKWYN